MQQSDAKNSCDSITSKFLSQGNTVELQWLEILWDYENIFETRVVRANEY